MGGRLLFCFNFVILIPTVSALLWSLLLGEYSEGGRRDFVASEASLLLSSRKLSNEFRISFKRLSSPIQWCSGRMILVELQRDNRWHPEARNSWRPASIIVNELIMLLRDVDKQFRGTHRDTECRALNRQDLTAFAVLAGRSQDCRPPWHWFVATHIIPAPEWLTIAHALDNKELIAGLKSSLASHLWRLAGLVGGSILRENYIHEANRGMIQVCWLCSWISHPKQHVSSLANLRSRIKAPTKGRTTILVLKSFFTALFEPSLPDWLRRICLRVSYFSMSGQVLKWEENDEMQKLLYIW